MKKKIIKWGKGTDRTERRERGGERRDIFILFFSSLYLFLRSMKIGPQVFVGTEGKVDL